MSARVEHYTATVYVRGLDLTAPVACVVIRCNHDGCAATHAHPGDAEDVATAAAKAAGWTWDGGVVDGCPAHPGRAVWDGRG